MKHIESKILDAMRFVVMANVMLWMTLQKNRGRTNDYYKMDHYSSLLKKSIHSILQTEEEKTILSLFRSGGTISGKNKFKGMEDFKLITFLIVR